MAIQCLRQFSCQPPTTKAPVQTQASPFGICGGQTCTQDRFLSKFSHVGFFPPMFGTHVHHQFYTVSVTDSIIKQTLKKTTGQTSADTETSKCHGTSSSCLLRRQKMANQDSIAAVAFYRVTHSSRPAGTRQRIATTSHWEASLSVMKCVLTMCTITLKLILRFARAQSVLRVCKRTSDSYMSKYSLMCYWLPSQSSNKSPVTTNTLLWICLSNSNQFRPQAGPQSGHNVTCRNWTSLSSSSSSSALSHHGTPTTSPKAARYKQYNNTKATKMC